MVFNNNNNHLQNELVAWLDERGVHKPLRPIDVPEQQLPLQLFTDDLRFIVKLFQTKNWNFFPEKKSDKKSIPH